MIIYGWHHLEGVKENVLRLNASKIKRERRIKSPNIYLEIGEEKKFINVQLEYPELI